MLMKVGSRYPVVVDASSTPSRRNLRAVEDLDATVPLGQKAHLRPAPEVLPMRCLRCQGPVEKGVAPVHLERDGYSMAWEQVPAWVCRRCELAYFEPEAVDTVRKALQSMRRYGGKTSDA